MEALTRAVLARLPLAEAVLTAWHWMADDAFLDGLFARHRGRCYTRAIRFPVVVRLIHDVLVGVAPSAHRRFTRAIHAGELTTTVAPVYEKLGRLPLPLSMAFLADCTARLREVFPDPDLGSVPAGLGGRQVVTLDGKAIKRVAKRLRPLRGLRGGVLGGRALVAQAMNSGLVLAMHAEADGQANDVRFVPDLVPAVRTRVGGPILWVADRQFAYPEVLARLSSDADRFLVRYHGNVRFTPVAARGARPGTDGHGRAYRDEWGWLGGPQNPHRRFVRRVALELGAGTLVVVTDLLDADRYPATDLLETYRQRWGIEGVFQQITEVFGLARLIGGTPEATVFQLSFALVLYNLTQAIRAFVAGAGGRGAGEVSAEKVFRDVTADLVAWRRLLTAEETSAGLGVLPSAAAVRDRLTGLLAGLWRDDWVKARRKKAPRPHPARPWRSGEHQSVYRLREAHKHRRPPQPSSRRGQDP
jgi:hypothetical protein